MFLRRTLCLFALALAACERARPIIVLPRPPETVLVAVHATPTPQPSPVALVIVPAPALLSDASHSLIVEFEVGGERDYNPHPEWPGYSSGVTVGVGYDCGMTARAIILSDWSKLVVYDRTRLADTSGIIGQSARARLPLVHDIIVSWSNGLDVFDRIDVTRTFQLCHRTFRGFDNLRPNAQGAIVSLVFNRGDSFAGPNRTEMRDIRDYGVPNQDYARIANQLRAMTRIWRGTDIYNGMKRRREAEAQLTELP